MMFGHEKLVVYKKSMEFVAIRRELITRILRRVIACDHFERASESILLNIAEGNGRFSKADQVRFLRISHKATVQSASLLDLAVVAGGSDVKVQDGKGDYSE